MRTFVESYGKATSIGLTDDVSVYDAVIILIVNTIDIPNPNRQLIYGPSSIPFIVGGHTMQVLQTATELLHFIMDQHLIKGRTPFKQRSVSCDLAKS